MAVHAFNPTQEDLRSSPVQPTGMVAHTYNREAWKDQTLRATLSYSEFKASHEAWYQTRPQSHPMGPSNRVLGISWGSLKPSMGHITLHPSVTKAQSPSLFGLIKVSFSPPTRKRKTRKVWHLKRNLAVVIFALPDWRLQNISCFNSPYLLKRIKGLWHKHIFH